MIEKAVQSGNYGSDGDVVRDALRLWEQREESRLREISRLKKAYDEGITSGEGRVIRAETLLTELKTEARQRG